MYSPAAPTGPPAPGTTRSSSSSMGSVTSTRSNPMSQQENESRQRIEDYYAAHPDQQIVLNERFDQALAELSLARLDHQWPVEATVTLGAAAEPVPSRAVPLGQPQTMDYIVSEHINDLVRDLTLERAFPQLQVRQDYLDPRGANRVTETAQQLVPLRVEPGLSTDILHISRQISSGTAQGTVYAVDVVPNRSYHYVEVAHRGAAPQTIHAVLKKSPIYIISWWLQYVGFYRLQQLQQQYNAMSLQDRAFHGTFLESQATLIIKTLRLPENTNWQTVDMAHLSQSIQRDILEPAFKQINNASYIDAVVSFAGGKLVESGLSPFFPLLYGTFRALDRGFFDKHIERIFGADVQNIPVQIIIEQKLDGSLKDLVTTSGWLLVGERAAVKQLESKKFVSLDADRTMSVFAQIVFGLAGAQRFLDFVHNDLHWQNVMYEDVPVDHVLYYEHDNVFYRVPTYGKWMRLIDFGRSRIKIGDIELYSSETLDVDRAWDISNKNNDLLRVVSVLLLTFFPATYDIVEQQQQQHVGVSKAGRMMDFFDHVVQCGSQKATLFDQVDACVLPKGRGPRVARAVNADQCWRDEFSVGPFRKGSTCHNAVPVENIQFFDALRIDPSQIPADAIVYPF